MGHDIQIFVYGSLRQYVPDDYRTAFSLSIQHPLRAAELLKVLSIPVSAVQMVMVNHRAVSDNNVVNSGDRVAFFPREYPLFVDWNDFRWE